VRETRVLSQNPSPRPLPLFGVNCRGSRGSYRGTLTGAAAPGVSATSHPRGQKYLVRLEKKHDKGKALTILAHKLARAIYYMLKRKTAFDMDMFLRT
jgi:hypothetical protein